MQFFYSTSTDRVKELSQAIVCSPLPRCVSNYIIRNYDIRGRVSKEATNGSKTAVMGIIGFVCVTR
jgi:hypothetical protein